MSENVTGVSPQLYSASARVRPDGSIAATQVSSAAYFGALIGPPIIGFSPKASG